MAVFAWSALIDRARVYIDDDHKETDGYISPETWLSWAFTEYSYLYKKWIRMGLVKIECMNNTFQPPGIAIPEDTDPEDIGVLAVVGVAEDLGNGVWRTVTPIQSAFGRDTFWQEQPAAKATGWTAEGNGDNLRVFLNPMECSGNYMVRWIPTPIAPSSTSEQVDLPFGCDERLVLGMARRAMVKDLTASALLRELIQEADTEIAFNAAAKNQDGPRVRRVRPTVRHQLSPSGFPSDPSSFRYV